MSDETGNTKAILDFEASNQRIRERLKKVAAIAEAALSNQPNEDGPCWEHLVLALSSIETEMLIHTAEKPLKNWERFANRSEAIKAHKAEGVVFGCGWGEIEWLYMDYIPEEPRIDYLCRLRERSILKGIGYRELERLKKAARSGAAASTNH